MAARKSGAKNAGTSSGSRRKNSQASKSAPTVSDGTPKKRSKPQRTPQEEERIARQREANLEKARVARAAKQKAELDDRVWPIIAAMRKRRNCKCKLRKGMTLADLRPLNGGCTSAGSGIDSVGCVCPTLDAYRRHLENPDLSK
jgi:hypothetical protein